MTTVIEQVPALHLLPEGAVAGKPGIVGPDHDLHAEFSAALLSAPRTAASPWQRPPARTELMIARPEALADLPGVAYDANHVLTVYAVQRAMAYIGNTVVLDGKFGPATERTVKNYQRRRGLTADGIVGPATQKRIILGFLWDVAEAAGLPVGLLEGQVQGESGFLLGAVNWSVAGGVDCFATQRRVRVVSGWAAGQAWPDADAVFDAADLKRAADVKYQLGLSASSLRTLKDIFIARTGTKSKSGVISYIPTVVERGWRLAALNHNYPSAADRYSRYPGHTSSYWTTEQTWVSSTGFKFADGARVKTPFDWCQLYALGAPEHGHEGNVVKLVERWTA